jgi:hypothetical protein
LRREGWGDSVFGIADTPEEADKRIYKEALGIVKYLKVCYEKSDLTKFIDNTKKAKNIESKLG